MTKVLYILMRTDLMSMTPGKAMAQSSHASNAFVKQKDAALQEFTSKLTNASDQKKHAAIYDEMEGLNANFSEWESSTSQGFGTVLVLGGKIGNIQFAVNLSKELGYIANMILDPTYPIVDGETIHYIPLETCGFIFVENKEEDETIRQIIGDFNLHP